MKVKVAVLQYDVPEGTDASFAKLDEMVGNATWSGAKLVIAPETAVGSAKELKRSVDHLRRLSEIAQKHKVYLATSFYNLEKGKVYNRGVILSSEGELVISQKKMYPAKPEVESMGVKPGDKLEVVQTVIGKLGMLICKDGFNKYSHFLYERFNELGAEIVCIPAWSIAWKELDTQEYVKAYLVYGAFTSRAYILMSDTVNKTFNSFGRSLILSPIKGVLKEASCDRKEVLTEELELSEVDKSRKFDFWWQPKKKVDVKIKQ